MTFCPENLAEMPDIDLVALCTRRPARLAEIADRLGVEHRYTDYRELLADPAVDAVSITTHIDDHRDIAIDALRSGKHVLLEKPMAPSVADCDRIVAAAGEAGGLFMVGHICRFDPRVTVAKEAIEQGRIGRIVSMHARRNLSKSRGRVVLDSISALMGDGIHDADLMLWFSQANVSTVYAQEVHPGQNRYPDAGWSIDELIPINKSHHGGLIVATKDGAVIGCVIHQVGATRARVERVHRPLGEDEQVEHAGRPVSQEDATVGERLLPATLVEDDDSTDRPNVVPDPLPRLA